MKKVLIIGLGSIGQRHLRNLKSLKSNISFLACRRKRITPVLNDKLEPNYKSNLTKIYNLKNFDSIEKSIREKPDVAFICTPSIMHITETIKCLKNNIHTFVEKPLGSNNYRLSELIQLFKKKKNKLITMMGFQIKFNPLYIYLKKELNKKNSEKILKIEIFNGERLTSFHKYEDYRISYASRKKLGGGVLLTQIHEIDYFLDLFGKYKIKILSSKLKKKSNLDIDVEDTFDGKLLISKKNIRSIPVNIHLDYYTHPKKKYIKVFFRNGYYIADFTKKIHKKKWFKKN